MLMAAGAAAVHNERQKSVFARCSLPSIENAVRLLGAAVPSAKSLASDQLYPRCDTDTPERRHRRLPASAWMQSASSTPTPPDTPWRGLPAAGCGRNPCGNANSNDYSSGRGGYCTGSGTTHDNGGGDGKKATGHPLQLLFAQFGIGARFTDQGGHIPRVPLEAQASGVFYLALHIANANFLRFASEVWLFQAPSTIFLQRFQTHR
jgi:hypothetical protein